MRRRIQIQAFERTRLIRHTAVVGCPFCFSTEGLLTSAQAARLLQVGEPSIRRWLAQGKAHGFKTPGGQYRICRSSLFQNEQSLSKQA
jgi:excisionase family DNA binding protein